MVGELRPRCSVCGKSTKGCGGCTSAQKTDKSEVNSRKRHLSAQLDRELAEEIEIIKKKIKTAKGDGQKSVEAITKKTKTGKERGPRNRVSHRSEVYQRFQEMMDQKMNDQNKAGLHPSRNSSPRKHTYNLRSGFWMQEAITPAPPLSFLSTFNTSEPQITSKYAPQDQCCHRKREDELNTQDISQSFMHKVDQLLKKARLDTSKVSNMKL